MCQGGIIPAVNDAEELARWQVCSKDIPNLRAHLEGGVARSKHFERFSAIDSIFGHEARMENRPSADWERRDHAKELTIYPCW